MKILTPTITIRPALDRIFV